MKRNYNKTNKLNILNFVIDSTNPNTIIERLNQKIGLDWIPNPFQVSDKSDRENTLDLIVIDKKTYIGLYYCIKGTMNCTERITYKGIPIIPHGGLPINE